MKVRIKRQKSPDSKSYWQTFRYDGPKDVTVTGLLDSLNYHDDLFDINGDPAPRIRWECSCLQAMCGSCAMVINGKPALACETFIKDVRLKDDTLTLEPLRKFPVICDLMVDRSIIEQNLKSSDSFIREYTKPNPKAYAQQYATAKCLKCGLCLEICPNYTNGRKFFGALYANDCYLITTMNGSESSAFKKTYDENFASGCSKALTCMKVCPQKIQTIASIARMNKMK